MKSIRTKVIFKGLAVMAFTFFGMNAIAQEENVDREEKKPPTFAQLLEKMDANKDGKLAKDEAKGRFAKHFARVDSDKDGFVTQTEFDNAPRPKRDGKKPRGEKRTDRVQD